MSIKKYIQSHKILFLLVILYVVSRLPILDHAFLLRGERDIVLTGYSLLKTGKDFYGNIFPVQFFRLDQPSPMLSFYFSALSWIFFPIKSVFFARLPYVIVSSLSLIFIYEIITFVTKNKKVALIAAALFGFNPGMYHLGTLALEINLAMPLLLAGMLMYLKQRKVFGWILMGLSFFTYNGFRPLIPFVLVYLEFFALVKGGTWKSFFKNATIQGLLFIAFFAATYFFIDGDIMTSRSSDIVFLSYGKIAPEVDFLRNTSVAPQAVASVLNNKITVTIHYMIDVFFEGISLQYLFFRGDRAAIYTSTFAGQFFSTFVLFYLLGFVALGRKMQKEYFYILGFIPVALVPSIVNIDYVSVAIRSLLATVSYAFIIALGIDLAWTMVKGLKTHYKVLALGIVGVIFMIEVSYFGYNYVFRRPVTMFESYFEHERNIAEYIMNDDQKTIIYDDSPKNLITAYHILNPQADIRDLQKVLTESTTVYSTDKFEMHVCPASGEKDQMYVPGTVIAESCLDPDEYEAVDAIAGVDRIEFEDYSLNSAFFIYPEVAEDSSQSPSTE